MQKLFSIPTLAFLGLILLMQFSCSDDTDPVKQELSLAVVEDEFVINAAYEDLDFLTLDVLQSSGLGFRTQSKADLCVSAEVTNDVNSKKIIIDFGTGCTSPNGVIRKGKILLSYTGSNFLFPGTSITAAFDGYEVNGLKIKGIRTITNAGIDLLKSKVTLNVKIENGIVTWPDNSSVTFSSTQIRQVSLGASGYEATITGTASGKSREGINYTATVVEPLVIKEDCAKKGIFVPSSGIMAFAYQGVEVSADYGAGACDKIVKLIYPGGSKEITLD
jgi:hypothetical protein